MSASVIEPAQKRCMQHALFSLSAAAFCALFGAVYEHFSFGVYSNYMIYAFVFPLIAGMLMLTGALGNHPPQYRTRMLLHACAATLTVGSIAAGILRISGRDHKLLIVYPVLGGVLLLLTAISYSRDRKTE